MTGSTKLMTAGGGGVSIQPASSIASDVTVNVPSQNCTLGIQGPAFSAYYSGAGQSVSVNTQTKVILNQESFDTNNCFDSTTNYRFTPNVAGYYQINGLVKYATNANVFLASVANVSIWKNGSAYRGGTQNTIGGASYTAFSVSDVVYLNGTTDYVELYAAHNYSPILTTLGSDVGAITVYFSGSMVRAA